MKGPVRSTMAAAAILASVALNASAQNGPVKPPMLLGTTGACNNVNQGGPCTQQSTLVQIDPLTGVFLRTIGPVGYTVNGLAWDATTGKLYATTPPGDISFHGLLTINPHTGAGTPVNRRVVNFGLPGSPSPIHSITIDTAGRMAGWYDEFPPPVGVTDTFVQINPRTGVATEFPNTGIDTSQNGLSFSEFNTLWNIDAPRTRNGTTTQTAYIINPKTGKALCSRTLTPPTAAALGDFNPENDLYYGLSFDSSGPRPFPTFIEVVDLQNGTVTKLGQTLSDVHTLAFVKERK